MTKANVTEHTKTKTHVISVMLVSVEFLYKVDFYQSPHQFSSNSKCDTVFYSKTEISLQFIVHNNNASNFRFYSFVYLWTSRLDNGPLRLMGDSLGLISPRTNFMLSMNVCGREILEFYVCTLLFMYSNYFPLVIKEKRDN